MTDSNKMILEIDLSRDRTYRFCPSIKTPVSFTNPVTVDWGDDTSGEFSSTLKMKHKYPKDMKKATIVISNADSMKCLSFKDDEKISTIIGVLPTDNDIISLFEGCKLLNKISPDFLRNHRDKTDVSGMFKGCENYKDGTLILTVLGRILVADELFADCKMVYSDIESINYGLFTYTKSMRGFFKNNFLTDISSIKFEKLALIEDMTDFFSGNQLIMGHVPYLSNVNLVKLDNFLSDSRNIIIDKNWLYYLKHPHDINTNKIFHESIRLNGM